MKIAATIARILLGLLFTVFGLNGFLQFLPAPPPTGLAGQFVGVLFASHFYVAIFGLQLAAGVLLLVNRFVPIALVFLGPIIVNILLFHALIAPQGLPVALVVLALWSVVFFSVRRAFKGIFAAKAGS
jgi:putative oxidoreductase